MVVENSQISHAVTTLLSHGLLQMLKKMGDANIALEDTVVNVHGLDTWATYLDKIDVMLLQSAVDWPAGRDLMRRWFVDNNWNPINPTPSTYDAYRWVLWTMARHLVSCRLNCMELLCWIA